MYNAWLDLFIKLPCFGLFREGQREGAAWEACAFCTDLFNYVFRPLLHCQPVRWGCSTCPGSEVGGQPSGQARAPDPWLEWGQEGKDASQKRAWGGQMAREGHLPSTGATGTGGRASPPTCPGPAGLAA